MLVLGSAHFSGFWILEKQGRAWHGMIGREGGSGLLQQAKLRRLLAPHKFRPPSTAEQIDFHSINQVPAPTS